MFEKKNEMAIIGHTYLHILLILVPFLRKKTTMSFPNAFASFPVIPSTECESGMKVLYRSKYVSWYLFFFMCADLELTVLKDMCL